MQAKIVSRESLANITEAIFYWCNTKAGEYMRLDDTSICEVFKNACKSYVMDHKQCNIVSFDFFTKETLFRVLEQMNRRAWRSCFFDNNEEKSDAEEEIALHVISNFPKYEDIDKFQLLKNMRYYLYNCTEGEIYKTELYKTIEEIVTMLISYLVDQSPEYERAEWC